MTYRWRRQKNHSQYLVATAIIASFNDTMLVLEVIISNTFTALTSAVYFNDRYPGWSWSPSSLSSFINFSQMLFIGPDLFFLSFPLHIPPANVKMKNFWTLTKNKIKIITPGVEIFIIKKRKLMKLCQIRNHDDDRRTCLQYFLDRNVKTLFLKKKSSVFDGSTYFLLMCIGSLNFYIQRSWDA